MNISISIVVIFLVFFQIQAILSESPTCGSFDFNDPLVLNEFRDCNAIPGSDLFESLVIASYSESTFVSLRPDSQHYLTTDKSVSHNITQCISTKTLFHGNFSSFSFQIGIHLRNNNNTDQYNNVQLFVDNKLAFQINMVTNDWQLYEQHYTLPTYGAFDGSTVSTFEFCVRSIMKRAKHFRSESKFELVTRAT